jgi:hypothetical protein
MSGSIKRLKQSGKWKGQTKLSKHGSGRVRRILSPFCVTKHSSGTIPLWGELTAPGGSRHEKGHGGSGSHAQHVDCCRPSHPDGGG